MPSIDFSPEDDDIERERVADLIRTRRGGALINLDRMLLHSPPFAEGFNFLLPRVRNGLALAPLDRELVICAVASLCGAAYELHHHTAPFLGAGGTLDQLEALSDTDAALAGTLLFDARQRAILAVVKESTRTVEIPRALLTALREQLADDRLVMEVVAVCACYNMIARLVVGLDIPIEAA